FFLGWCDGTADELEVADFQVPVLTIAVPKGGASRVFSSVLPEEFLALEDVLPFNLTHTAVQGLWVDGLICEVLPIPKQQLFPRYD
ncbi:hypothetical protein FRC03_012377, partial [Tulasnella sp. 419]